MKNNGLLLKREYSDNSDIDSLRALRLDIIGIKEIAHNLPSWASEVTRLAPTPHVLFFESFSIYLHMAIYSFAKSQLH